MDHDDFANVSWQSDQAARNALSGATNPRTEEEGAGPGNMNGNRRASGPLGRNADPLDTAGVGEGTLECTVTSPIKENDGSKDAYVSYLVTTNVRSLCQMIDFWY
jgi:sorting nexin-4